MRNKNGKIVGLGICAALLMFGATFAIVPLYRSLCLATGLNTASIDPTILPDTARNILVQFVTANNAELPWEFHPEKNSISVHPGDYAKVNFFVKNNSGKTMTVQAIPSYAPEIAVRYFHKIECFCFTKQTLIANEAKSMPVVFKLDRTLPSELQTITLGYTLFDVTKGSAHDKTSSLS